MGDKFRTDIWVGEANLLFDDWQDVDPDEAPLTWATSGLLTTNDMLTLAGCIWCPNATKEQREYAEKLLTDLGYQRVRRFVAGVLTWVWVKPEQFIDPWYHAGWQWLEHVESRDDDGNPLTRRNLKPLTLDDALLWFIHLAKDEASYDEDEDEADTRAAGGQEARMYGVLRDLGLVRIAQRHGDFVRWVWVDAS